MQVIDALPIQWRNSLTSCGDKCNKTFALKDHIKLCLNKWKKYTDSLEISLSVSPLSSLKEF